MEKVISIIIPTCNMEKYLRKCLDSLIVSDKCMERLEVLVINDGSKDSSSVIGHEYESKYPQTFRVIDKENGNYGSCVNRGLKDAKGKYVKILDADDSFDNTTFDNFIMYLHNIDSDLVISDFCIVDENGVPSKVQKYSLPKDGVFSLNALPNKESIWLWHHAVTYKLNNLKSINYKQLEGISYTDEEWVFKPMVTVHTVSYFSHILYYYLRGREGQTYDPSVIKKQFGQMIEVKKSIFSFSESWNNKISDKGIISYVDFREKSYLMNLYQKHLIEFDTKESLDLCVDFDKWLKEISPRLYGISDKIVFDNRTNFKYVRRWRKDSYNQNDIVLRGYRYLFKLIRVWRVIK